MKLSATTTMSMLLALATLLSACGTPPSSSIGAQATASPDGPVGSMSREPPQSTPGTTPSATEALASPGQPSPTSAVLPPLQRGSAVRVIVAELNVREQPSMSAQRVATVDRGTVLLVGGYEPITADGYVWWRVSELTNLVGGDLPPLPTPIQALGGAVGFIATAKGDTRHAEAIAPRCPPILDLPHVAAMLGVERAHCLADRPLTFTGTLTCGPCEGMGPLETYEPRWLAAESYAWLATAPRVSWADLELHIPPDVAPDGIEEQGLFGSILRVVGHFNDPRSASCEIALYVDDDTSDPVADDHAEQACRQQFVVESFEILGTDPEYQPPF